jgi:hypothetical protein
MSAVALAGRILEKRPGELRCRFWLARILAGFLFQALGAVSAESCGRDSFAEAAGFRQLGLVCLLRLTTIKPSEIVEGL